MGIFNFIKKKRNIIKNHLILISKNQLSEWIDKKKKEYKKTNKIFMSPIRERISKFEFELKNHITILENNDINDRMVEERIKSIVKKNLNNYILALNKIIEQLNNIDDRNKIVNNINYIFKKFEEKTSINYQKVSFLLEKNMYYTKNIITRFLKDLNKILENNKKELIEFEIIEYLYEENKILENNKKELIEFFKIINKYNDLLKELNNNLKKNKKEIEKIKQSKEFEKEVEKEKNNILEINNLEKLINNLKSLIDFKSLTVFYHKINKDMEIIKEYKNNFNYSFKNFKFEILINLLINANIETKKISKSVQNIEKLKNKISNFSKNDLGIPNIEKNIEIIKLKIDETIKDKNQKMKKINTIEEKINEKFLIIKKNLKKINIEFK